VSGASQALNCLLVYCFEKGCYTVSKELAVIKASEYTALATDQAEMKEALAEVLAGESFGVTDFDVVTVPTGASAPMWNLPSSDPAKVISGIIIHQNLARAMWLTPIEKQGDSGPAQPDCTGKVNQADGNMYGSRTQLEIFAMWNEAEYVGRPENLKPPTPTAYQAGQHQPCDTCPFSQFNTSKNGKGQFCGLKRILYILTPEQPFPLIVRVPSKSLKSAKTYLLSLAKKAKRPGQVVTNLALQKVAGSPAYYVIDFTMGEVLDSETAQKSIAYAQAIRPFIEKASEKAVKETFNADPEY
jgi:hypothetical protein